MIVYRLTNDGAFIAGDTESRITAYAYPTSEHARAAKRKPANVAAEMIRNETRFRPLASAEMNALYDVRNWIRLEAAI